MTHRYNPDFHHRRSVRLRGHDYSSPGMYFVTICTWERRCMLGEIQERRMVLNEAGTIVDKVWQSTALVRPIVVLDEYMVMPNHLHAIIILSEDRPRRGEGATLPSEVGATAPISRSLCDVVGRNVDRTVQRVAPTGPGSGSIGAIVGQFKSLATKWVNQFHGTPGCPLWQLNYFEHLIRSTGELEGIRDYIRRNPANWHQDEDNPAFS